VKFVKEFNTGSRVLSTSEPEELIRNAAPFMQDLIVFGLHMGLRVGEIFSLRWSNVDWAKNVLNVFAHKNVEDENHSHESKSAQGHRRVRLEAKERPRVLQRGDR
jgi:integrase